MLAVRVALPEQLASTENVPYTPLELEGRDALACYRAKTERGGVLTESDHHRYFCGRCGTHLYAWNSQWPALVHPVASAIDTPLPTPPALLSAPSHRCAGPGLGFARGRAWFPTEDWQEVGTNV